jgi:PAS domain S-box-containing protein
MIMATQFNPILVVLSVLVAMFASYVALNLANSVAQSKGRARIAWLSCGALAMGVGIWSMHFIGMLAFEMPGMAMAYDVPLMVLSIIVAVGASALALYIVSRPVVPVASVISGGIAMAAAIAGMHYIGMFSMRMEAVIEWNIFLVVLSVVIALVASLAALRILIRLRDRSDHFLPMAVASVVMGTAIAGMHYTGMVAATFIHTPGQAIHKSNLMVSNGLTAAVIAMALLILCLALAGSMGQRVLERWQRHSQNVLITSEERFRLLVEAVKDYAIIMLDPRGSITTWNAGAERITGYRPSEVIGKHFSIFNLDDDSLGSTAAELQRALRDGHVEIEGRRRRRDGSQFWANVVITPLYDENKRLTGYSKIIRDITQLRESETRLRALNEELEKNVQNRTAELQERERQLRSITNALPVLVAQVDSRQNFLFANDAFCKWFGIPRDQVIGASFKKLLGDERYLANESHIQKALAGQVTTYERESVSAHDQSVVFNVTFVP